MRRPCLLIGLFLLATVLVDVAALAVWPKMGVPHLSEDLGYGDVIPAAKSEYFGALIWSLYLSQVNLAAIWLALGLSVLPLRFIGVFSFVLVWNTVIFRLTNDAKGFSLGMIFTGMMVAVVAVTLLAARQFGLRLAQWCDGQLHEIAPSGAQRWQFSLLYLFGLMTVLAVFLGMLKFIFIYDVVWELLRGQLRIIVTALRCQLSIALHAIVAWGALWIALSDRRWLRMWLGVATIAAVLGTSFGLSKCQAWYNQSSPWLDCDGTFWWHYGWRDDYHFDCWIGHWTLAAFFALEAALLLGSLWIFRLAGYRVVFRRSAVEEEGGKGEKV